MESVRRNSLYNILLTGFNAVFPVVSFAYVARALGPTYLGEVNFATSVVGYFAMIAAFGIPTYGIRAIAAARGSRSELDNVFTELVVLALASTASSAVAYAFVVAVVPTFRAQWALFAIVGGNILTSALSFDWVYGGLEQYRYLTIRSVLIRLVSFGAIVLLVHRKQDMLIFAAIGVSSTLLSVLVNAVGLRGKVRLCRKRLDMRRHLGPAIRFLALAATVTVYFYLGATFLGFAVSSKAVGLYSTAFRIAQILIIVISSTSAVAMPRLSHYLSKGKSDEYHRTLSMAFRATLVLSIPGAAAVFVFARELITVVGGNEYLGAVPLLQILSIEVLLSALSTAYANEVLIPNQQEKHILISALIGAIVNVSLNVLVAVRFGAVGIATAFVAAELAVVAYQIWVILRRGLHPRELGLYRYLVATIAAVLVTLVLHVVLSPSLAESAVILLIDAVIYIVLLRLMREPLVMSVLNGLRAHFRKAAAR